MTRIFNFQFSIFIQVLIVQLANGSLKIEWKLQNWALKIPSVEDV